MGHSGNYVKTFAEADIGVCADMPCGSDYPHHEFDVIKVEDGHVTLRNRGQEFKLQIKQGRTFEYAEIEQRSLYERAVGGSTVFKVFPMQGVRN